MCGKIATYSPDEDRRGKGTSDPSASLGHRHGNDLQQDQHKLPVPDMTQPPGKDSPGKGVW